MDVEFVTITPYFLAPVYQIQASLGILTQLQSALATTQSLWSSLPNTFIHISVLLCGRLETSGNNMTKAFVIERDDTGRIFKVPIEPWTTALTSSTSHAATKVN